MIAVRRAQPADDAFIDALGGRSVESSISQIRPAVMDVVVESFRHLREFCRARGAITFVALADDALAGFLILLLDVPDEVTQAPQAFIAYMAVDEAARRSGAGRALLAAAEQEASRRGLPHLSLMVSNDNDAARRLYASAGFVDERTLMTKPVGPP